MDLRPSFDILPPEAVSGEIVEPGKAELRSAVMRDHVESKVVGPANAPNREEVKQAQAVCGELNQQECRRGEAESDKELTLDPNQLRLSQNRPGINTD